MGRNRDHHRGNLLAADGEILMTVDSTVVSHGRSTGDRAERRICPHTSPETGADMRARPGVSVWTRPERAEAQSFGVM